MREVMSSYTEGDVEVILGPEYVKPELRKPSEDAPLFKDGKISADYQQQLYDAGVGNFKDIEVVAHGWRYADLEHQPGERLPYIRLGQFEAEDTTRRPILYVPGFTEGIEAKSPFALALADSGTDVIMPGQNRTKILKDSLGKKSAVHSQASNYLAVIEAEGLTHQAINVVGHSYGAMIFDKMVALARDRGWTCFDDADVILAAPGGIDDARGLRSMTKRFIGSVWSETVEQPRDIPDEHGEMIKTGMKNLFANVPRAGREAIELSYDRMSAFSLSLRVGSVAVLGYAEDRLFPHTVLEGPMEKALEDDEVISKYRGTSTITYATPYSTETTSARSRGAEGATHDDEQFNPFRVANSVNELFELRHQERQRKAS